MTMTMLRPRNFTRVIISVVVVLLTYLSLKSSFNLLSNDSKPSQIVTFGAPSYVYGYPTANVSEALNTTTTRPIREIERQPSRISYTLHPQSTRPYNDTFNPYQRCPILKGKREGLPAAMKNATGVLDFTTSVTTDLKILFMGDSVSLHYSQGFEEAAGAQHAQRTVIRYAFRVHEGLHVSAPVRGGGVVAGWRITGLLRRKGENEPLPNEKGGGWVREDVRNLTALTYNVTNDQGEEASKTVGSFDAMVIRIPHGWIPLEEITAKVLNETVQLAHELFGVSVIVFVSMPFVNNVVTKKDLRMLKEKNDLLRDFVRSWQTDAAAGGVKHLLLLEFGDFADSLMEWNARLMGYDTSVASYKMETLSCCPRRGYTQSIAQVCSARVLIGTKKCVGNSITVEGTHWCMGTIGGRFFAGTSCLLACAYNDAPVDGSTATTNMRHCEKRCNDQFMSLEPVHISTMVER
jgi:hypothetical protein